MGSRWHLQSGLTQETCSQVGNLAVKVTMMKRSEVSAFFLGGLAIVLATAFINIGFVALDDYTDTLALAFPAQLHRHLDISQVHPIRSLVPAATLVFFSQCFNWLGAISPVTQIRWVLCLIGLINYSVCFYVFSKLITGAFEKRLAFLLLSTHFLLPFVLTRAMIESLSIAPLMLSLLFAQRYAATRRTGPLIWASLFLWISFLYRYQVICILPALVLVIFLMERFAIKRFALFFAANAVFFVMTGLVDAFYRGKFQQSLFEYFRYNWSHSASYGESPFYTYLLVCLGLLFFPFSFHTKIKAFWARREEFLLPGIYLVTFLAAHSLIRHKEERFLIPVLPILMMVGSYYFSYLNKVQAFILACLNFVLLCFNSMTVSQNNIVGLARSIDRNSFSSIINTDYSFFFLPEAYMIQRLPVSQLTWEQVIKDTPCRAAIVIKEKDFAKAPPSWKFVMAFKPGPLEKLAIQLNPSKNERRSTLLLFTNRQCASQ